MSIRNSMLAILAEQPAHGYGLKSRFEESTAGAWPLNVGQVYTTLARLERDGLVQADDPDQQDRQQWRITKTGRRELAAWYDSPVDDRALRDELAIKLLLAIAIQKFDVQPVIQRQRAASMRRLQEYTQSKREIDPDRELARYLLLEAMILKVDAEIKWLDLCETILTSRKTRGAS